LYSATSRMWQLQRRCSCHRQLCTALDRRLSLQSQTDLYTTSQLNATQVCRFNGLHMDYYSLTDPEVGLVG